MKNSTVFPKYAQVNTLAVLWSISINNLQKRS